MNKPDFLILFFISITLISVIACSSNETTHETSTKLSVQESQVEKTKSDILSKQSTPISQNTSSESINEQPLPTTTPTPESLRFSA